MNDNISAFNTMEYNTKIKQTLPYYDEFYKQVIELVKTFHSGAVRWLDVGCGTGKMGSVAFENVALEKFVFSDCSEKMIKIVKERFDFENTEFVVCDAKELDYVNEFDVITAIQVNHYLKKSGRKAAFSKYYDALKKLATSKQTIFLIILAVLFSPIVIGIRYCLFKMGKLDYALHDEEYMYIPL